MTTPADVFGALGYPELDPSGLVTASHDQPAYDAFQHLASQKVCSALVWNPAASSWAGFLDLGDYARHLVDLYSKATSSPEPLANPAASLEATSRYMPSTVLNADHVTATNPFVPVKEHESMLKALEIVARSTPKVHRVPMVSATGQLKRIISQSSIIHFVHTNSVVFGPLLSRTVPLRSSLVTVSETDTVIRVFQVMVANGLSAVPIIDGDGRFVTPISISDIRLILLTKDFPLLTLLEMPVMDYMQHIRLTQNTSARTTKALVIAIPSTATFMDAATKLDVLHVHRVYVEDAEGRLVGVVSIRDVCGEVLARFEDATRK